MTVECRLRKAPNHARGNQSVLPQLEIDDYREREYVAQLAGSLFDIGETSVEKLLVGLQYTLGPARARRRRATATGYSSRLIRHQAGTRHCGRVTLEVRSRLALSSPPAKTRTLHSRGMTLCRVG